ncbi:polysaccharide deacetylase family protein [Hydrogenimonas cancrithermarum]|uniref:Polysaccharide deacetylase n=1 Tax=Hydrogenimonas cancrithermarum TaxID=2993563 RepID=A0ABM8FLA8_9BACT|nr:polysaccharide deacetylase family protein [Hydrogenimonas cancrithermarum]BDY13099.1 polysaccharide deacetylase [Hydrogenimonas cancrithermarum]
MRLFIGLWLIATSLWADAHIFVYHRFGDTRHPSTDTTIDVLKKQFDYFKAHGYEIVPLSRLVTALKAKRPIPDNWVVLTIDDSFKSFYVNGLPIFKAYGYPFTLFVYTKGTESHYGDFMTWEQINDAKKYGELGFHSHTHPHMVSQSDTFLEKDFETGLALMKLRTGERPKYFAYPYGEYDGRVKAIAESFGFDAICNQNVGAVSEASDPYDLDRIALTGDPDLKSKLGIKFLPAEWIEPKAWPKEGIVRDVRIKIDIPTNAKRAQLYLTGYGWRWVDLNDGEVNLTLDKPLKNRRSRLILKLDNDKISTKILVKP